MDRKLKSWCYNQRLLYKYGVLSSERISKLETITEWVWDCDIVWMKIYNDLKLYCDNKAIPTRSNKYFGGWINNQRTSYTKGGMSKDKIHLLESIRGWVWGINNDAIWVSKYICLKLFCDTNNFPKRRDNEFGNWINKQKEMYRNNKMSEHRISKLESINGWSWNKRG